MGYSELKSLYTKRRANLVDLLQRNPKPDAARQHQIYGAICEIDILLKTIEHLHDQEMRENLELDIKSRGMSPNRV